MVEVTVDYSHYSLLLNASDGSLLKRFAEDNKYYRFTNNNKLLSINFIDIRNVGMSFNLRWLDPIDYHITATQKIKYIGDLVTTEPAFALDFFPHSDDLVLNADKYYWKVSPIATNSINFNTKVKENLGLLVAVYNPSNVLVTRENHVYNINMLNQEHQEFGFGVLGSDEMYPAANGKALAVMGEFNAKPYFINWGNGHFSVKQMSNAFAMLGASTNVNDDGKMAVWCESPFIKVADITDLAKPLSVIPFKNGEYTVISPDGRYIAVCAGAHTESKTITIGLADRKTNLVKTLGVGNFTKGVFSNDDRYFFCIDDELKDDATARLFDLKQGVQLWQKDQASMKNIVFPFIYSGTEVGYVDPVYKNIIYLKLSDGTPSREEKADQKSFIDNPDLQRTILPSLIHIPVDLTVIKQNVLVDSGKYTFASFDDNTLKIFDRRGTKLADIILSEVNGDWAIITPDGRFDASERMMKQLYYTNGRQIISLEKLYEQYYTPNLGGRLLSGESFSPLPPIKNINPPPRVKISYEQLTRNLNVVDDKTPAYNNTSGLAEVTVNATSENDKVDEIRLFHNGKIVNLATRGLFVTDNDGNESKKYKINLLPGNNNFRAIALNSQRTESEADEITVSYAANGNQPTPTPKTIANNNTATISTIDKNATMYLMVVGINAYTNKINPLTYALPDATSFKDEIEKDVRSVIANVKTYFITNAKADKAGIINAFNEIKKAAKPQDIFVFYYAGHGYINPTNKEFYLVSADVADGGESLLKNGIPAKDLQQYAVDIQAQKQLFILDACQSAGAFDAMLKHDGEQQKSLAVVARSTGTHWMAASGSTETAKEFGELGHGAFTYVLLQALQGQAAANKMITVNGLKTFMQVQVPELMKKYNSSPQYPASYGLGNDFPVEIIK